MWSVLHMIERERERQKLRVRVSVSEIYKARGCTQFENYSSGFKDKRQFCYDVKTQVENFWGVCDLFGPFAIDICEYLLGINQMLSKWVES